MPKTEKNLDRVSCQPHTLEKHINPSACEISITAPLSHLSPLVASPFIPFACCPCALLYSTAFASRRTRLLLLLPLTSLRLSAIAISVSLCSLLWLLSRFPRPGPPLPCTSAHHRSCHAAFTSPDASLSVLFDCSCTNCMYLVLLVNTSRVDVVFT